MVTDDWQIFRLDNLASEVAGGTCGDPDRAVISNNRSHN